MWLHIPTLRVSCHSLSELTFEGNFSSLRILLYYFCKCLQFPSRQEILRCSLRYEIPTFIVEVANYATTSTDIEQSLLSGVRILTLKTFWSPFLIEIVPPVTLRVRLSVIIIALIKSRPSWASSFSSHPKWSFGIVRWVIHLVLMSRLTYSCSDKWSSGKFYLLRFMSFVSNCNTEFIGNISIIKDPLLYIPAIEQPKGFYLYGFDCGEGFFRKISQPVTLCAVLVPLPFPSP